MTEYPVLELRSVGKQYGEVAAVKDFSTVLTPGIYGLLGQNGAGKSTIMNILSGLLEPSEGSVLFCGKDIRTLGKEYRSVLGVVPQQQRMYEFFTGFQFLEYMAALKGIPGSGMSERIAWVLEQVELTGDAGRKIGTYSGGMKQRLLLAQALLNDPEILLLDEPTAGLDPRQRILFRNLIAGLGMKKILIFATHVVSDIESIAREVLLLQKGKLLERGTIVGLCQPLEGRVVEIVVPSEKITELTDAGKIVSFVQVKGGVKVRLLLYGHGAPAGAKCVVPTLEEVFLDRFE